MGDFLTIDQICDRYGMSNRWAREIVREHSVPVLKAGRRWLFDLKAEKAFSEAAGKMPPAGGMLSWTEEAIAKNASPAEVAAVYFLLSENKVVYVGQSMNVLKRLGQHGYKTSFDAFFFIPCHHLDLLALEDHYIRLFQPRLNKFGVDRG